MMMLEDVYERAAIMEYDAGCDRGRADRQAWLEIMGEAMPWFVDDVVFAVSPANDLSIQEAKNWIKKQGLTADEVSMKKSQHVVYVVAKKDIA